MRRVAVVLFVACFALVPSVGYANHIPPSVKVPQGYPVDVPTLKNGDVRFIGNAQTARGFAAVLGETAPFERDGRRYMVTGSTVYGLSVVDITDPLKPAVVSEYAAAFGCPTAQAEAMGPMNPGGWENDLALTPDGRIAILGTDEIASRSGRCHDPAGGGLEFVDITDVTNPRTLHLTRQVGQAHSVTIDPKRPWLAYLSTSDGKDFMDVVDFKSCLGGVAEIDECKPVISRVVFDKAFMPGLTDPADPSGPDVQRSGCHDVRFRGDRAYCAAIGATSILDVSRILGADGRLTGTHLTAGDDACTTIAASAVSAPGVSVTDCTGWTEEAFLERGARPADVRLVSVIKHDGSKPPTEDIDIAHQAEAIGDGTIMMITDERGGGLGDDVCPGGGVWFYDIRDETKPRLMRQPDGRPGVYLTEHNIPNIAGRNPSCTVHYGSEFADENLLVFAWYTNGTRVVRYTPDFTKDPPQITFEEEAAYTPALGWTIQSLGLMRNPSNPSELIVYAGDASRGIDVLGVTVPRITRAAAFRFPNDSQVLGERVSRDLPATGLADPATIALALLAIGLAIGQRIRRITM